MFTTGEEFNPSDLYKIDLPQEISAKQKDKAVAQAKKLLLSLGIRKSEDIAVV